VPPVLRLLPVFIDKVIRVDPPVAADELRHHVLAEIVAGLGVFGVCRQAVDEKVAVEAIDAHGDVALVGAVRRGLRTRGLLLPAHDAARGVELDHAEPPGLGAVELDGADGHSRSGFHVLLEHQLVVHFVGAVARERVEALPLASRQEADQRVARDAHGWVSRSEFPSYYVSGFPATIAGEAVVGPVRWLAKDYGRAIVRGTRPCVTRAHTTLRATPCPSKSPSAGVTRSRVILTGTNTCATATASSTRALSGAWKTRRRFLRAGTPTISARD